MPWQSKKPRRKLEPLTEPALYDYAVAALGRRMRTVAELKRLMHARVESGEPGEHKIDAVLQRLEKYGYIDDAAFAAVYTRLRQENEGFGKLRVKRDLARKGIARDLIGSTVDAAYENTSEEETARHYLARKRISKPQNQKEIARVARRLFAAGFSASTLSKILKNWEVECSDEDLAAYQEAEVEGKTKNGSD